MYVDNKGLPQQSQEQKCLSDKRRKMIFLESFFRYQMTARHILKYYSKGLNMCDNLEVFLNVFIYSQVVKKYKYLFNKWYHLILDKQ